jgi:hypothetical protein
MHGTRLADHAAAHGRPYGRKHNGPSLIHVPDWVEQPLGRYNTSVPTATISVSPTVTICSALAHVQPWGPATQDARFAGHVASPDVHVDDAQPPEHCTTTARRRQWRWWGPDNPGGAVH